METAGRAQHSPNQSTRRVLLLADDAPHHAPTTREHREALQRLSRHEVHLLNPIGLPSGTWLRLHRFDAVVIHYSIVTTIDHFLPPHMREALARFKGVKIQIIQDDYRDVERFRAAMRELGIGVLFTLVPKREIEQVWPAAELPGVERITTLAGYVPHAAERRRTRPLADRPFDIVYRGRDVPFWIGRLAQEKAWIGQGVAERADEHGLVVDINWRETARIYGRAWSRFLSSGRSVLGAESGASITDFDGTLKSRVEAYLEEYPGADFEEVHAAILAPFEGNVMMNIVSPRVFEAAAARTALVMFPGEYSHVVVPGRDYIQLEKDFSNLPDVVEQLRDLTFLSNLTETVHERLIASSDYRIDRFVDRVDRAIDEHSASSARYRADPSKGIRGAGIRAEDRLFASQQRLAVRLAVRRTKLSAKRGSITRRRERVAEVGFKLALAVVIAAREPAARQVARQWVAMRAKGGHLPTGTRALVEDVLKLGIAAQIAAGRRVPTIRDDGLGIELYEDGAGTILRTVPAFKTSPRPFDPFEITRWDHSTAGGVVHLNMPGGRTIEIIIGDNGSGHEFRAIAALAAARAQS